MEKNTHSLDWLALGAELIDCLRSKGNHRLTRYDAFLLFQTPPFAFLDIHRKSLHKRFQFFWLNLLSMGVWSANTMVP